MTQPEYTCVCFQMYGVNVNLDDDGNVETVSDGVHMLAFTSRTRGNKGCPGPTC